VGFFGRVPGFGLINKMALGREGHLPRFHRQGRIAAAGATRDAPTLPPGKWPGGRSLVGFPANEDRRTAGGREKRGLGRRVPLGRALGPGSVGASQALDPIIRQGRKSSWLERGLDRSG